MTQRKPTITQTTHTLPFDRLSPQDFERLCLALLPREGFENPQHYGAAGGERGRDIVARRDGELWYVQCKRVKRCGPKVLLNEIEKVRDLIERDPYRRPAGILFIISCNVSATARDRAEKRCSDLGLACDVWIHTDLDARLQPHRDIIKKFFSQWVLPTDIPFQAPPLPPHFVPRPEVSDALKARLLADKLAAPGVLVVSAIHGPGGIGKSVLAAALAHDAEIHKRFPDGVIWVVLGQQPELLPRLHECIQALGDYSFHPMTVDGGSAQLRSLLHERACLLVVDDVWQADHARPFLVSGPRCRVLITTRDAKLAREVGAHLYDLDVMTEAQALTLFEARLGPLNGEREQAAALARRLGYLPLALELAAAQMEAGFSWIELQESFRQAQADLADLDLDEATHRNESLRLSFRLSLEQLPPDDLDAFAWLGVLPEDVRINPAMAATLWNQLQPDAHRRLRRFEDKALLRSVGGDRYIIHDLLHEEAKLRLTERMSLPKAHVSLLERYRALTQANLWHTLPDDGYIHAHLAWHLQQAGQEEELHILLSEQTAMGRNGWYETVDRLGQNAGYLDDVVRAWNLAIRSHALSLQIRYALIESTIHTLAQQLPVELLAGILRYRSKLMSPAVVLDRIRQMPKVWQRADTIHDLAPYLPNEILPDALDLALGLARENERGLVGLAPYLPPDLVEVALWRLPDSSREAGQYLFFEAVAPTLPDRLLDLALCTARRLPDADCRAVALGCLVARLRGDLVQEVVREALSAVSQTTSDPVLRAKALMYLAPYVSPKQIQEIWEMPWEPQYRFALDTQVDYAMSCPWLAQAYLESGMIDEIVPLLKRTHSNDYRYEAISRVAPELPEECLSDLMDCLPWDTRSFEQPKALGVLARYGSTELQDRVLNLARSERYDSACRLVALATIAPHLRQQESQNQVWEEVAAILHQFTQAKIYGGWWNRWQLRAYREVVEHLPTDLVSQVVQESRKTYTWPDIALESLDRLSGTLRQTVCSGLLTLAKEGDLQWAMLTKLTPYISPVEQEHLFAIAMRQTRSIGDQDQLDSLAPHKTCISGIWADRPSHDYFREHDHVRVLLAMVPHSSEIERAAYLALEALCALDSSLVDVSLREIMPMWPLLDGDQKALVALRIPIARELSSIRDKILWRAEDAIRIWAKLLSRVSGDSQKRILDLVLSLAQETSARSSRVLLLSLIVDEFDEPHRQDTVDEISHWLAENGTALEPGGYWLPGSLLDQVLSVLREAGDHDTLVQSASLLLKPHVLTEALRQIAENIEYHKERPDYLIRFVAVWAGLPDADAYQILQDALPLFARGDRDQFLWDLHAIAPVILKLGGEEAIQATIEEVERVMSWWP